MARNLGRLPPSFLRRGAEGFQPSGWRPSVDVYRCEDGWLVKLDLAGVRPQDLRVASSGTRLTVSGHRRDLAVCESQQAYSMEISYNRFERTIDLPFDLDRRELTNEYRDGMLLIRISPEGDADE